MNPVSKILKNLKSKKIIKQRTQDYANKVYDDWYKGD